MPSEFHESAWGATPAQAWTRHAVVAGDPALVGYAKPFDEVMAGYSAAKAAYEELLKTTAALNNKHDDTGWEKPALDVTAWKDLQLPQNWEATGLNIDGVVWFRRTVEIPAALAGKDLALGLGPIDDQDTTWWDGEKVGAMGGWNDPRDYTSSALVDKPVAVRYAWSNNPEGCNLYNQAMLPASPFRTDDWPALTNHQ